VYVHPTGEIHPCCVAKPFEEKINLRDFNTIDELINSDPYKRIRKQLVNGEEPKECASCFLYGNRHREHSNREFIKHVQEPNLYNEDYSVNKVVYLDLRLSNHCNFRCRMCYHGSSSTWYDYWGYILGDPDYNTNNPKYMTAGENGLQKFSEENIDSVRKIYLAGGEPFITPTTFELLERFTDEQAARIDVLINTNLSNLQYKGENILEKLKRFKKINISASCDGYGKIGEYQRPGFNSDRFFKNLKELTSYRNRHNNFIVQIDYTISTINMYHTFDFINFICDGFDIGVRDVKCHNVTEPFYFAPATLSNETKDKLIGFYIEGLNNLKQKYIVNDHYSINEFIKYLNLSKNDNIKNKIVEPKSYLRISLPETLKRFDEINGTDYKEVCPWIEEIFNKKTII
jgi:organic radical activating enzyme